MAVQKAVRILYQAKNNQTGLTDVKAQIYLNGAAKAVGGSAVLLSEVDPTNSPGLYELLLSAATLTGYGVVAGSYNCLEGYIDSVSKTAKAPFREELTVASSDDIDAKLGTPAGASVSADIAAVKTDTAAIKVDLETGANSLANILAAIQIVQNNAGFAVPVPKQFTIPSSGNNVYVIPLTIYNEKNGLVDPDSNSIVVTLQNQAGVDRGAFMTGYSAGSAPAVRDSLGQYHITTTIPSTEVEEELTFSFAYAIGGLATARKAVTQTLLDVNVSGLAQQSTLLAVQTAVANLQTDVTSNVEGTGFTTGSDSLHAISTYLQANLFVGGKAI